MIDVFERLARDEVTVAAARQEIWRALDETEGHRRTYSALCRWTWRALIEHRLDADLGSWHRLLLDLAAKVAISGKDAEPKAGRRRLDPQQAAERLRALADLVRLSINAAEVSAVKELVRRAHVVEILRCLASSKSDYTDREVIKDEVGLQNANLSRILTLLTANGLIERQTRGKSAAFRLTNLGASHVQFEEVVRPKPVPIFEHESSKTDLYRGVIRVPHHGSAIARPRTRLTRDDVYSVSRFQLEGSSAQKAEKQKEVA